MKLSTALSLITIAGFGAGLAACGGGSVSTGGGDSSGARGASSSLVVQAPRSAGPGDHLNDAPAETRLAALRDFLIDSALAQSGEQVFLLAPDGSHVATGTTDGSGQVAFPVSPGDYIICIGAPDLETGICTADTQSVGDDEVVVVTLGLAEDVLVISGVAVERAEDNVVAFQDPDNAHKTLVCHQSGPARQFTISVGTPAAQNGHMAHGDALGPCPDDTQSSDDSSDDVSDDDSRGGPPDKAPGRPDFAGGNQNT